MPSPHQELSSSNLNLDKFSIKNYVSNILYEDEDYRVFLNLLEILVKSFSDLIEDLPNQIDPLTCSIENLRRLAELLKCEIKPNIDIEFYRIALSEMIRCYNLKGTFDEVINSASYSTRRGWVRSHIWEPNTYKPYQRSDISFPQDRLFTLNRSKLDVLDKLPNATIWRKGIILISVPEINDILRSELRKVLPAGLKPIFEVYLHDYTESDIIKYPYEFEFFHKYYGDLLKNTQNKKSYKLKSEFSILYKNLHNKGNFDSYYYVYTNKLKGWELSLIPSEHIFEYPYSTQWFWSLIDLIKEKYIYNAESLNLSTLYSFSGIDYVYNQDFLLKLFKYSKEKFDYNLIYEDKVQVVLPIDETYPYSHDSLLNQSILGNKIKDYRTETFSVNPASLYNDQETVILEDDRITPNFDIEIIKK